MDPSKRSRENFRLGMDEWTESEEEKENSPPAKRPRKSLSLPKGKSRNVRKITATSSTSTSTSRWSFLSETEEAIVSEKCVPRNTAYSTKWAVTTFSTWAKNRNTAFSDTPDKLVPADVLQSTDCKLLCKWLSLFVAEARKQDGSCYPPKSLYLLMTGLLRHMRSSLGDKCPNFLDTKLPSFEPLHNAMDNVFRQLRADGVGAESKATEVFSKEEEDLLWSSGTLSTDSPKGLFNAVFFLNGKSFCLRGGDEHRNLKLSQFTREANRYKYVESASKNRAGGLGQLRVKNKTVYIDMVPEAGIRCHVYVLDMYF